MNAIRLLAVVAAAVLVWPLGLAAQSRERVAFVSVVSSDTGEPVSDLSPTDIVIREDRVQREVLRVTKASGPMPIAVLIDNSSAAEPAIAQIRQALTAFVHALGDLGPVSFITMAERPTLVTDYTSTAATLEAGVTRIFSRPDSGATVLDAVFETATGIVRRESERAAIVMVSANGVPQSTMHHARVVTRLKEAGATLHAVVLSPPGSVSFADEARQRDQLLDRGVRETGGVRRDVLTSMTFESALGEIARVLTHQFRVVYARPQSLIPPESFEVTAAKPGFMAYGTAARGQTP